MKFGPVTKPDRRNKISLPFFQFAANLEQSGGQNFYLTKTENRIKKSLKQLSHYCFE